MATFSISAVARKAQATANGSTTQFAFSFSVNTEADVAVFVGTTLKTISTHYTVSITASTGAGSITFTSGNTPSNGQIVTIMSKTALARSSVYTSGGTINATSLETDFDTNMMLFQQQDERLDRVITAPVDDATSIDMTLPNKDARKGTVLGFNATSGNPEAGPSITAVQSLADVTTAINLLGTSDAVSDMNTLATSSNVTNQNTLAGIASNITTVAGIASNVTAVAGDITDIGAVAGKATEIGLLANSTIIANMGQLGTSAVVEDMGLLATSAVIEDMGLLANSAVIEDMGLLATSAVIEDMGLLATSAVIEDMGLLATSSVISDMSTLAGSGSTPTVTSIGVSSNATFADNSKAIFGAGSDLQIYHDGSHSFIHDSGTGDLYVRADDDLRLQVRNSADDDWVNALHLNSGGETAIHYNGNKKLATTNTGIDVTGTVTADGLTVQGGSDVAFFDGTNVRLKIQNPSTGVLQLNSSGSGDSLSFATVDTERMRIDSSGNLLVGKTSPNGNVVGGEIRATGQVFATASSATPMYIRRKGDNSGELLGFETGDGAVGSINISNSASVVSLTGTSSGGGIAMGKSAANVYPARPAGVIDNTLDFGSSSYRWDDIFATNGTIQTSDRNEKQDIASLTSAEMLVAARISALFKTFRWRDKVAAKGNDARTHTGIIAQDVQAAFTAESLDAGDYSLFISTTWWEHDVDFPAVKAEDEVTEDVVIAAVEEELDEEGNVLVEAQEERTEQRLITEAVEAVDAYTRTDTYDTQSEAPEGATSKTRMGIRYPELLSFVAAYNEQRFAAIETRLAALEAG